MIQEDGSYSIEHAPGGEVKVTVTTVPPIPGMPAIPRFNPVKSEPKYPAGKYVKIPQKYSDADQSGLKLTVKRGSQEFLIDLEG